MTDLDTKPWYRQFWPWFIIALPASAVVASLYTVSLAVRTTDSLVVTSDDGMDVVASRHRGRAVCRRSRGPGHAHDRSRKRRHRREAVRGVAGRLAEDPRAAVFASGVRESRPAHYVDGGDAGQRRHAGLVRSLCRRAGRPLVRRAGGPRHLATQRRLREGVVEVDPHALPPGTPAALRL